MALKAQATREKLDKLDCIKIKMFCASKDSIELKETTHGME